MTFKRKSFGYLLSICLMLPSGGELFAQNISFGNLTTEDGLSNNHIYDLIQDKTGFIWFATDDGLNRFDGYSFKIYRHNQNESVSISSNSVWCLLEDRSGFIWIGTKSGELNRYDPLTDTFSYWNITSDIVNENSIKTLYEDSNGNIWIGTYKSGLYKFDPKTERIYNWKTVPGDSLSLSNNYVTGIFEDTKKNIWISTYHGFNKFNLEKSGGKFRRFFHVPNNNKSLSHNIIWSITESAFDPDFIWLGTANGLTGFGASSESFSQIKIPNPNNIQFGESAVRVIEEYASNERILWINSYAGLLRYNINTGSYSRFTSSEDNPKSLVSNQINNIIKDRSGVMWIATQNGLSYSSSKSLRFNSVYLENSEFFDPGMLAKKDVTAITQTKDGRIWFGSEDGLYYCKLTGSKINVSKHPLFNGVSIWALSEGESDELWMGTFGSGLSKFYLRNNRISPFIIDHAGMKTASKDYNKVVYHDLSGDLWIGFWGAGLGRIKKNTNKLEMWQNVGDKNPHAISHNDVWAIYQDTKGRMWIGTNGGGLNLFHDLANGRFVHFTYDSKEIGLNSNSIFAITESKFGKDKSSKEKTVLWIGTSNGLNKFVINESGQSVDFSNLKIEITSYTTKDGLPDNSVNSIVEDEKGNLWIGTSSGISFFDLEKTVFTNFSKSDGLLGGDFNTLASLKSKEGIIFFGSTKGLNFFDSKKISISDYHPPVVITDFKIFNAPVKAGKNSPLKFDISKEKEIILSYSQDIFSFEFAALDYNSPHSIKYAYQLEGFDKHWVESGSRRFVTYTNLTPDKYKFKVKATNADGMWNEKITEVNIIIGSPWYATGWALVGYIVLIITGLLGIRKLEKNRIKLRNELKMHEFEANKLREVEAIKSRFFANLSHEFRTPLMLIKGPIEQLLGKISDEAAISKLNMISKNVQNLQTLIDQLLDLSKLESASIPVKARSQNLVNILRGLTFSFDSLVKQKNISLSFNSNLPLMDAWIDNDKFEKVINNLLSNAIKFTNDGRSVTVECEQTVLNDKSYAIIKIRDTGTGIPKSEQDKIFDRFYQVEEHSRKGYGGTGIGLALVKELVDLHRWEISVSSKDNVGTEFILKIPLYDYLDESQKIIDQENLMPVTEAESSDVNRANIIESENETAANTDIKKTKPSILIIEDSKDVRTYLADLLSSDYKILEAENGVKGIESAAQNSPDLIISDIMMPSMDGIELCRRIKTNWETSHIPVILLTAKVSQESKLEGLETGADDYLTKPFEKRELFVRIKNLLDQRKRLKEKFAKEIRITSETVATNFVDNEFLTKAFAIVDKNLGNADFKAEDLAKELFMSLSQLRRKLIALTGESPGEFIRIYRLKRSAQMILEKKLSITQIAFEVGYNSPSHFSKAFQQQFNCTPSEFTNQNIQSA